MNEYMEEFLKSWKVAQIMDEEKSVKIWQKYGHEFGVQFFWPILYTGYVITNNSWMNRDMIIKLGEGVPVPNFWDSQI